MAVKKKLATTRKPAEKSSRTSVAVNFTDVESRGGKKGSGRGKRYPEGDYGAKVISAQITRSRGESKTPEIMITYKITSGHKKAVGGTIVDDLYLTKAALWRVRQALEAMGIKVPNKKFDVDVAKMKGKEVALTLSDDEYDDKIRSRVTDTFLLSELEEDDSDDDESEDEEDEEEEDEDEEEDDGDDDEEDDDEDEEEAEEEDDDLDDLDLDDI